MVPPAPDAADGSTYIDDSGSSLGSRDEKRTEGGPEGGQEGAWREAGNPRESQEEEEEGNGQEEEEEEEKEESPMPMCKFVLGLRRQPTSKGGRKEGREGGREGGKTLSYVSHAFKKENRDDDDVARVCVIVLLGKQQLPPSLPPF
jgi:hypothetical protein